MSKESNPYDPPLNHLSSKGIHKLSWRARRNYKKLVESKPVSEAMKGFQKKYQEIYKVGDPLHILIDTSFPSVNVPVDYIHEDRIVIDVCPLAVTGIKWDKESLSFKASFSGRPIKVQVPLASLLAIFNPETKLGFDLSSGGKVEPGIT